MKHTFWVSVCYEGAHGGGLYLRENKLHFRTVKLILPENIKSIDIEYENIDSVSRCSALAIFPAVKIFLKDGSEYKFISLISANKIADLIRLKIKNN